MLIAMALAGAATCFASVVMVLIKQVRDSVCFFWVTVNDRHDD